MLDQEAGGREVELDQLLLGGHVPHEDPENGTCDGEGRELEGERHRHHATRWGPALEGQLAGVPSSDATLPTSLQLPLTHTARRIRLLKRAAMCHVLRSTGVRRTALT